MGDDKDSKSTQHGADQPGKEPASETSDTEIPDSTTESSDSSPIAEPERAITHLSPLATTTPSTQKSSDAKTSTPVQTLRSKVAATEKQLSDTLRQISELPSFPAQQQPTSTSTSSALPFRKDQLKLTDNDHAALTYADQVFSRHISLLKKYNEIKDITLGMLSILAEKEGRRLAEIMEEYGLDEND